MSPTPPRPDTSDTDDTSPGEPPLARLDDALGFDPLDAAERLAARTTAPPVAESRVGPGLAPTPTTRETRRPTDRGLAPPPLPRSALQVPPPLPRQTPPPPAPEDPAAPAAHARSDLFRSESPPRSAAELLSRPITHAPSPTPPGPAAPALHAPPRSLAEPVLARVPTATVPRPTHRDPARLYRPLSWLALALFALVVVTPTHRGAPWELVLRPTDPSFVALTAMVLVVTARTIPLGLRARGIITAAGGAILLGLSLALLHLDVARLFDAQPALVSLFAGAPAIGSALVVAATLVPAGLFLRALAPRHMAATGLVGFGAALVLAVAFGVGRVFPESPLSLLFDGLAGSRFVGDRIAAATALPAVLALLASLVFTFPGIGGRIAAPLALILWALAFLPALVLALFVAPADQWLVALGPVKLVVLMAASALCLASGLAHMIVGDRR